MNRSDGQRLVVLETKIASLEPKMNEIHADVKTLLAAYNRQRGFAHFAKLLWGTVCAGAAIIADRIIENWHVLVGH